MSRTDEVEVIPRIKIIHIKRPDGRFLLINVASITSVAQVNNSICHIYFGDSSIYAYANYQVIRDFLKGDEIEKEFPEAKMK